MELAPVLIVKPMIWGTRFMTESFKKRAGKHQPKFVFTTSLEGGIGRLMTASLAAWLGDSTLAHGLDTGSILTDDLWKDEQFIKNGCFKLPGANHLRKLMNCDFQDSIFRRIS